MKTLCLLLPVYNLQGNLTGAVTQILELLEGFLSRFELCILDDGSTDDTAETAHELAACYPQIRVIRHPIKLGLAEAIQTALDHHTQHDVVLVGDDDYPLAPDDLRTLWHLRDARRRTAANYPAAADDARIKKLLALGDRRLGSAISHSFEVIDRQAFEQLRLQQALELVRRIDRGEFSVGPATARRPTFLARIRRFANDE